MENTKKGYIDLTEGPIFQKLIRLAAPIVGAQAVQMLYNLSDMFWVGRLGPEEVAATGAAGLYMWLSVAVMLLASAGAGIGASQAFGAKDEDAAKAYAQNGLFLSAVLGALFGLVLFLFPGEMVRLFGFREAQVSAYAEHYLVIVALPIPLTFIAATLTSVFNAGGDSRMPMICNIIGMVVNIILDPVCIFVLGLGVQGAAISTAIGQALVCVLLIIAMKKGKHRPFERFRFISPPSLAIIRQFFKWTIPMSIESGLFTFMVMLTSRREAFFGANAMSISRVGSQIESLTWLVGGAFGSAILAFVGQNYGAGAWDRIRKTFGVSTKIMVSYGLFVSLLLAFGGKYLFSIFLQDPELVDRSASYMRILAICQIPMCLEGVAANVFRGRGHTLPPSIISVVCNVLRVPAAYLLSSTSLGLHGVWIGITLSACAKGIWAYAWYYRVDKREALAGR